MSLSGGRAEFRSAQLFFEDKGDIAKAKALNKGDKVTATCTCEGMMGNILLKNCALK